MQLFNRMETKCGTPHTYLHTHNEKNQTYNTQNAMTVTMYVTVKQ